MNAIPNPLRPAQDEVRRGAHSQDLTEVPKRARLDREAEASTFRQPPSPAWEEVAKPELRVTELLPRNPAHRNEGSELVGAKQLP
jgi:hypothetical protein